MSRPFRNVLLIVAAALQLTTASAMSADTKEWRFNVSLDGKSIGYHLFQLSDLKHVRELRSEARFSVTFLFLNAYRYVHDDREVWSDGCLERIDARTNDNGEKREVNGARDGERFRLTTDRSTVHLDRCVLTFAYWNPEILTATHLLNSQTGEHMPVSVQHVGTEVVLSRKTPQSAERYRIVGNSVSGTRMVINLWYAPDMKWLALESTTDDGRRLRYTLQ